MILPWQTMQWQQFWNAKQEKRLPHALLFTGTVGMGKGLFAEGVARALLCTQSKDEFYFCHTCHACQLVTDKVHPNVLFIHPEETGHAIKVDQIRSANEFIQQTSLQGEYRLVIIHPAACMNSNAANALLKTLEEPPPGAIIILISDEVMRLPATIRSRCQRIHFSKPALADVLPWLKMKLSNTSFDIPLLLKLAHGAPLAALELTKENRLLARDDLFQLLCLLRQQKADPISSAVKIQHLDTSVFLDLMLSWIVDLLRLQLEGDQQGIVNQDYAQQLIALKPQRRLKHPLQLMLYLQQLRQQMLMGIPLNKQLLTESVLIRWTQLDQA